VYLTSQTLQRSLSFRNERGRTNERKGETLVKSPCCRPRGGRRSDEWGRGKEGGGVHDRKIMWVGQVQSHGLPGGERPRSGHWLKNRLQRAQFWEGVKEGKKGRGNGLTRGGAKTQREGQTKDWRKGEGVRRGTEKWSFHPQMRAARTKVLGKTILMLTGQETEEKKRGKEGLVYSTEDGGAGEENGDLRGALRRAGKDGPV